MDAQQRVRCRLVTRFADYAVADTPIALPLRLGRPGLSEVVNHLIGSPEGAKQPFEFILEGALLQTSLRKAVAAAKLTTEATLTLEYFPALRVSPPASRPSPPSWATALAACPGSPARAFVGRSDGSLAAFSTPAPPEAPSLEASARPHAHPVRGVAATGAWVFTASKDFTVVQSEASTLATRVRYVGPHRSGVERVAPAGEGLLYSADGAGVVCLWRMPGGEEGPPGDGGGDGGDHGAPAAAVKRSRTAGAPAPATVEVRDAERVTRAHQQSITGLWASQRKIVTASWDGSVKVWDAERDEAVTTFNSGKAATSVDVVGAGAGVLASSHADGRVRVWDPRLAAESAAVVRAALDCGRAWVSQCSWSPRGEGQVLAASLMDGSVRILDVRGSAPLAVEEGAHEGAALCVGWGGEAGNLLLSGGSDSRLVAREVAGRGMR